MFKQHLFKNNILLAKDYKIFITPEAFKKMWYYVKYSFNEISWLGYCEKVEDGFLVKDVFLPKQTVSAISTEISEDSIAEFYLDLMKKDATIGNKIRLWGHSHPGMSTSPSFQDERQIKLFMNNKMDYFIRLICSSQTMSFTIYLLDKEIILEDVPWEVFINYEDLEVEKMVRAECEKKVTNEVLVDRHSKYWRDNYGIGNYQTPFHLQSESEKDTVKYRWNGCEWEQIDS